MHIMKNNPSQDGIILSPKNEYGNQYTYCMFFNNEQEVAFADTHEELLSALINGYAEADENRQEYLRIIEAQNAAAIIQAEIISQLDPNLITEKEYKTLTHPKQIKQEPVLWWTNDVPLVVVETAYAPYTDVEPPASNKPNEENLWRINPLEDETFLINLHEIGYIRLLGTNQDTAQI